MTPAAKKRSRKKKKTSANWLAWWPVALGVVVTPFTVRAAGILALTGPAALRMLYPFALIPAEHAFGLRESVADAVSQAMMWLQFPLYGLLLVLLARRMRMAIAVVIVAALHMAAVGGLWLLNSASR